MDQLSQVFTALADPTRRAIVQRLSHSDATVGELSEPFSISAPAISRHLRVLERAQLITRTVEAQRRRIRLNAAALAVADDWLEEQRAFWEHSLDRLERALREDEDV